MFLENSPALMWATILIFLTFLQKQCIYLWRRAPLPPGYIGCSHPQPFATFPNISSVNPPSPTQPFPLTVHMVHLFTKGDPFRSPIGAEIFQPSLKRVVITPPTPYRFLLPFMGLKMVRAETKRILKGQIHNLKTFGSAFWEFWKDRYTTFKPLALQF